MKIIFSLVFTYLISFQLIAQENVQFTVEDLSFNNEFEQETYLEFAESDSNLFEFLFAVNSDSEERISTFKNIFDSEMKMLKQRKVHRRLKKDVKNIYEYVHERFLRKYTELSYFDEVFKSGTYNCVSAVALYAMVFEELKIQYAIKETPTHVYLIVDPGKEQLLIETTDPNSGFASFSPGYKQNFVGSLINMKLISDSELAQKGFNDIFDEYYFGGKALNLRELSSLQYYNKGVKEFNEGEFRKAYETFKKAHFIYSNEQIEDMLKFSLINSINQSAYSDWSDIMILPDLEMFIGAEINTLHIEGEFSRMLQYTLINNGNEVLADSAFNWFIGRVNDSTLKQKVQFNYNYELAVIAYNRADFKKSYELALNAYRYNSIHMNSSVLLLQAFASYYQNREADETFKEFGLLTAEFPELLENNKYLELYHNLLLSNILKLLDEKELKKAESLRIEFEESLSSNKNSYYDENLLGNAYSMLSLNYFRKGYASKAKQIVAKGLSYKPGNYQLKSAKKMLNY